MQCPICSRRSVFGIEGDMTIGRCRHDDQTAASLDGEWPPDAMDPGRTPELSWTLHNGPVLHTLFRTSGRSDAAKVFLETEAWALKRHIVRVQDNVRA